MPHLALNLQVMAPNTGSCTAVSQTEGERDANTAKNKAAIHDREKTLHIQELGA
jgi:hypothetical protein